MQTLAESTITWTDTDRRLMSRALELARKGIGQVSPGPLVGCVIVGPSGEIAGEGFYLFAELNHAETIALAQAGEKARGGTAYVSLEPHAHHGRTPPCTDALIAAGIKRVVAPIEDLNPKVTGKGFAHLRASGIQVQTGLLADEATQINEAYLHFMQTGLPFVHLKLAVSLDGKIATRTGDSRWVSGPESLARVHELRHQYDAILVGAKTAVLDDPLLTDRSGLARRQPLVRVVLDNKKQLLPDAKLLTSAADGPVLVLSGEPLAVLRELADRSTQSVLIEGGAATAGRFFDAGLVNKVTFFMAPKIVGGAGAPGAIGGSGVEKMADAWELERVTVVQRGKDLEISGYPRYAKG
ncbi:MAG TPA: bifunctional diaminohydroxyphosphoribosylaminopyrimidine deaminase/5-amino-6-(5-phosphoribosylamino)uracil reductase RibD [Pyrinomonadaceae bacterium]|nr:bifunctional diaminohydroxyphosphoribosylaminopyrimidine deaminase/5-amino-6-(5-phosphoribosylamino)uracil reductase RibD [Pyrinomonadaceae bacterium]